MLHIYSDKLLYMNSFQHSS